MAKLVNNLIVIKNTILGRFPSYMERSCDLSKVITKLEVFMCKKYITISNNSEEYVARRLSTRRRILVIMTRMAVFLTTIRMLMSLILKSTLVRLELLEFSYLMGDPLLSSAAVSSLLISLLALGL